jgi:iron complex transport system substrate-binding protein
VAERSLARGDRPPAAGDNGVAMRVVSLLPSATEIVYALGLGDQLVGRSHTCDYPEDVAGIPVVTSADEGVDGQVDIDLLAKLEPDLVLAEGERSSQQACCRLVREALRAKGVAATVVGLDPRSLEGIFNSVSTVGAYAEAEDEAVGLVELLRERLGVLENRILERRLQGIASRRVIVLESLRPPVQSGQWVPELVRRAGGWELLGEEGEEPEETSWERIREIDPEIIVLALRGHDARQAARELAVTGLPVWFDDLEAVRDGELFAVDGAGLILRPGPRVIEGVAVLAELFDPEAFSGAGPPGAWIPLGPLGIGTD